jgi:hypothetical protein
VFTYYEKVLFKDKFNEEFNFIEERLEIGKSLLSRILMQDMPPGILFEALQDKNLLMDDALQIYFNYDLRYISSYALLSMDRVQTELCRIFRQLLRKEISTLVMEDVRLFINDLDQCKFGNYREIYEAYDRLYEKLLDRLELGDLNPQNFLFRCWERIKRFFRLLRPVLAGIVLITAFGFLLYTLSNPVAKPGTPPPSIEAIGSVKLRAIEPAQLKTK